MDPLTILAGIKTGMAAGKTIAGLSKEIGNFFDATDAAKKQLQKKGVSEKSVNATAMDRWASLELVQRLSVSFKSGLRKPMGDQNG